MLPSCNPACAQFPGPGARAVLRSNTRRELERRPKSHSQSLSSVPAEASPHRLLGWGNSVEQLAEDSEVIGKSNRTLSFANRRASRDPLPDCSIASNQGTARDVAQSSGARIVPID